MMKIPRTSGSDDPVTILFDAPKPRAKAGKAPITITQALAIAAKITSKRGYAPILRCVLVDAFGLSATDLDVHIAIHVLVPGWKGAARPLHAKTLLAAVKAAGASLATIGPHAVALTTGSTIAVETLEAADFPSFDAGDLPIEFTMPAATLSTMLHRTAHAISTEETRYYLNGVYLHAQGQGERATLRAVASDGHRLVVTEAELPDGAQGLPGIIIPRGTVKLLCGVLGKQPEGVVKIKASDTRIQVTYGPVTLTSKLIDGTFPEYNLVVPHNPELRMTCPTAELRAAIKAVRVGAERDATVALDGHEIQCGANRATLATAKVVKGDHETGFNGQYLMDMLEIAGRDVAFFQNEPASPAIFSDLDDPSWFEVIMPKRVVK